MKTSRCQISLPKETWGYCVILVVIIVGAMIREINLLIILSSLMIGPLVVSWQVVRMTLHGLDCKRKLSDTAYPGELMTVSLEVTNPRKRLDSWSLVIQDQFVRRPPKGVTVSSKRATAKAFLPFVKTKETTATTYRGRLWQRGRYEIGPIKISTRIPIGLVCGSITIANSTDQLLVYPRLGIVSNHWKEIVKIDQMGQRTSRRNQGQLEGDFYGLRGWRTGDSQRWIHWRSTAKRNEIVVKQFEQSLNQNFVLLLDLSLDESKVEHSVEDSLPRTGPSQLDRVELAISFVATIVVEHCRRNGGNLVLGVAGHEPAIVRGPASNALVQEALEVLADTRATTTDRLAGVMDDGMTTVSIDDRVIIVSVNPVDLHDTHRFSPIWNDVRKRRTLTQAICVDVSDSDFAKWFTYDEPSAHLSNQRSAHVQPASQKQVSL
jgi:uncharacterized protein (DUF58 family)